MAGRNRGGRRPNQRSFPGRVLRVKGIIPLITDGRPSGRIHNLYPRRPWREGDLMAVRGIEASTGGEVALPPGCFDHLPVPEDLGPTFANDVYQDMTFRAGDPGRSMQHDNVRERKTRTCGTIMVR